jgi:predicted nucleic acid-binding protein
LTDTLIDAGPLVALVHADDQDHRRCVETSQRLHGRLVTTWPPLTEAMYLLSFSPDAQNALFAMIERGALCLTDIEAHEMGRVRALMSRYRDLPMDFADATLVHVAERENLRRIFTLDRRDFSVYRVGPRGRAFTVLP